MNKIILNTGLLLALALPLQAAASNPYSDEYLADRQVRQEYRMPSMKDEQWKVLSASSVSAVFVDASSVFITSDKAYFTQVIRLLSKAGAEPGSEMSARIEIDCAMGKTRIHDITIGDYYLGARGDPMSSPGEYNKSSAKDIAVFCISDRAQTLRKLDLLDKENRGKVDAEIYGRYDK